MAVRMSHLFVDNEINLYKKIIIEEMIRPYFISTVPAGVVASGTDVDVAQGIVGMVCRYMVYFLAC